MSWKLKIIRFLLGSDHCGGLVVRVSTSWAGGCGFYSNVFNPIENLNHQIEYSAGKTRKRFFFFHYVFYHLKEWNLHFSKILLSANALNLVHFALQLVQSKTFSFSKGLIKARQADIKLVQSFERWINCTQWHSWLLHWRAFVHQLPQASSFISAM